MNREEVSYRLLKILEQRPEITQRELAEELGISVGKVNYCLRALIDKGHIKFANFRRQPDKTQYAYLLTPSGMEAKARATLRFLRTKMAEYETIKQQIAELQAELKTVDQPEPPDFNGRTD
ncbi:MAG: MarR family EPS-associated transcriptional regulator [Pseudomonadota bacterium]|nr:MarR family EPS-associated transcriptional regulator [Pseudomonadota bacterium]